ARLLTHWIPPHELATKMSVWNTSHSIGASVLAILCGYVMGTMGSDLTGNAEAVETIRQNLVTLNPALLENPAELQEQVQSAAAHVGAWQWCFWVPALFALAGAIGLMVFLRDTPRSVGLPELEGTHTKVENNTNSAEYKAFLKEKVFRNPLIWILAFANFFVYVVRFAVLDWGPKFLQEARGLEPADAGWIIAVSEIMGIVGMLVAGWATDRFFKGKAHRTCVFCMLGAAAFMGIFYFLPGTSPVVMMAGVLGMVGFFIYGPQALIGIAAANQATKSAAATANGVTGIFGYLSTFVSGLGIGAMVDWVNKVNPGQGWNYVFLMMIAMAVIGMVIFLLMWGAKATGYDEQEA
ncbi:MAG: MFS transporter, partial [Alistipes sp.]|nr:MFS transporter [Alistipes sp.]